jgi:hypothetical protein
VAALSGELSAAAGHVTTRPIWTAQFGPPQGLGVMNNNVCFSVIS